MLFYYIMLNGVLMRQFTLGLNTLKNTYDIKRSYAEKLFRIEFRTKKSASAYVHLPQEWSQGLQRSIYLISYNVQNGKLGSLYSSVLPKIRNDFKKSFKQKLFRTKFRTKISVSAYVYLSQEWSKGAPTISMSEILQCTEMGNQIHFGVERCQK